MKKGRYIAFSLSVLAIIFLILLTILTYINTNRKLQFTDTEEYLQETVIQTAQIIDVNIFRIKEETDDIADLLAEYLDKDEKDVVGKLSPILENTLSTSPYTYVGIADANGKSKYDGLYAMDFSDMPFFKTCKITGFSQVSPAYLVNGANDYLFTVVSPIYKGGKIVAFVFNTNLFNELDVVGNNDVFDGESRLFLGDIQSYLAMECLVKDPQIYKLYEIDNIIDFSPNSEYGSLSDVVDDQSEEGIAHWYYKGVECVGSYKRLTQAPFYVVRMVTLETLLGRSASYKYTAFEFCGILIFLITLLIVLFTLISRTTRKELNKLEKELNFEHFKFETIMGNTKDVIFEYYPKQDLLYYHILGSEFEGRIKKTHKVSKCLSGLRENGLMIVHPEDIRTGVELCMGRAKNRQEIRIRNPYTNDEKYYWYESYCKKHTDEKGKDVIIGWLHEINERKSQMESLKDLSEKDSLTGILNKKAIEKNVELYTKEAPANEVGVIFFIDIDNFKNVNDTKGHLFGDDVLKVFAKNLNQLFRASDIVGRAGGDEFVVFMKNVKDTKIITTKLEKIKTLFIDTNNEEYKDFTCSIGIAIFPDDSKSPYDLFEMSDTALYAAKANGKNTYSFFRKEQ